MSAAPSLDRSDLAALADLCARAVADPPSRQELDGALFAPDQPAAVLGDPATGVVAVVACDDGAHIRLLAVDPPPAGAASATRWCRRPRTGPRAGGPPRLDHRGRSAVLPVARRPQRRDGAAVPVRAPPLRPGRHQLQHGRRPARIPDDPGGHRLAGPLGPRRRSTSGWQPTGPTGGSRCCAPWTRATWSSRATGTTAGPVTAFCAFEVNRRGLLGPVAVRPDLMGQGRGKGVLLGALHELRRRGATGSRSSGSARSCPTPPSAGG